MKIKKKYKYFTKLAFNIVFYMVELFYIRHWGEENVCRNKQSDVSGGVQCR